MGLGGSIASTVKNKISGYGGNLVSNAAGAAKSPKRTGSVNHDVEGLIEESQYIKGDKVLYYPLDIGTDANGHYLQFFIRKQANLKMTFKGNDGKEVISEAATTIDKVKWNLLDLGDKSTFTNNILFIKGTTKPSGVYINKPNKDNETLTPKELKELIKEKKLEDKKAYIPQEKGLRKKYITGVSADGQIMVTSGTARSFTKYEIGKKGITIYRKTSKGGEGKWFFSGTYSEKDITVAKQINFYTEKILSAGAPEDKNETPENEVKVGITSKYPSLRMESSIALFLPGGLKNETKPEWGETGTRISYEAQAMLAAASGDLQGAISGGGRAAEMAMKEKVIPNLMDRAGAKYGMAYTDRMQVFFKNMGKRSFSYTFKFMPKSRAESIRVDDIVKMFRFYGSPSYLNSKTVQGNNEGMGTGGTERGQSGGWSIMRQPQIFEIVYMYKDKRNEYLNRISHCVLDSVSITYNGDNNKFFNPSDDKKSGSPAPVETQIDLSFKEIEIITKDKIDQGF